MKNFTFKSVLAAAALLLGTTGSWAYEVPDGFLIGTVFAGTNNDGVIAVETFEGMDTPTGWTKDGIKPVNSVAIGEIEEVANVEVGETLAENVVPTYVGGKVMQAYLRQGTTTGNCYASFPFEAVSAGKLVFNADFHMSGANTNAPILIKFVDSEGNAVLEMNWENGSGVRPFVYNGTKTGNLCQYRTYLGFGIRDLVIDLASGDVVFTIDCIDRYNKRVQSQYNTNIGTDKNIASIQVGKTALSSTNMYIEVDNMSLYTVVADASVHNYTINAVAGGSLIKELAAGNANEGNSYNFVASEVIEKDGQYYVLDDANVENYKVSYVMGNADEVKEINYVLDESIVYYAEGETLGSTSSELDGASNGAYGHVDAGKGPGTKGHSIGSWSAGIYQASAYFVSADVAKNRGFRVRNTAIANADDANVIASINTTQAGLYTSEIFVISSEMDLSVSGKTTADGKVNQSSEFDYIIIRKVEDPSIIGAVDYSSAYNTVFGETMSFTDGSTKVIKFQNHSKGEAVYQGFNVMVSENATEFAALTSDWRDNYSDVADNWVTRYQVSSDGGENFDWIDWADNTMAADLTNAYVELTMNYKDGTFSINGTATNGSKVYAYNWKTEGHTGTISAKMSVDAAWLKIISVEESQEGGETGIAKINNKANVEDNVYFNMAGQRVAQPAKGLYIVNGKKVVIK